MIHDIGSSKLGSIEMALLSVMPFFVYLALAFGLRTFRAFLSCFVDLHDGIEKKFSYMAAHCNNFIA